ncbi:MAG: hypothetical protein O6951_00865 [Actinobacteria bacterium]|nr:hypothetical protein [Actinomycetota bacterium]
MTGRSSLDLLLEINQSEREAQLSHFDSLDTKAGLVLGFAGVLIALGNDATSLVGIMSIVGAALAAGAAVASFWPRGFPSIDPTRLGEYAASELAFTQLTVLDTLELMLVETRSLLDLKSRRLKWALVGLSAAAILGALEAING